jgi:hypothetical protein
VKAEKLARVGRVVGVLNHRVARFGLFLDQKSRLGSSLEGLAMEDVGIFLGHLVYFTALWFLLYGHFVVIWYVFTRFGMLCKE